MRLNDFNVECKKCRSLDCSITYDDGFIKIKCNQCDNIEFID